MLPDRKGIPYTEEALIHLLRNYEHDPRGMGSLNLHRHCIRPWDPGSTTFFLGLPNVGKTRLASGMAWTRRTINQFWSEEEQVNTIYEYHKAYSKGSMFERQALANARQNLFGETPQFNILFTSLESVQRVAFPSLYPEKQRALEELIEEQSGSLLETGVLHIPDEYYKEYNKIIKRCADLMKMVGAEGYAEIVAKKGRGEDALNYISRLYPQSTYAILVMADNEVEDKGYQLRKARAQSGSHSPEEQDALKSKYGYYNAVKLQKAYITGILHNAVKAWYQVDADEIMNPLIIKLRQHFRQSPIIEQNQEQDQFIHEALATLLEKNPEQIFLLEKYLKQTPLIEAPVLVDDHINPDNTSQRNAANAAIWSRLIFPWSGLQEDHVAVVRNTIDPAYPDGIADWQDILDEFDFVRKLQQARKLHVLDPYYNQRQAFEELAS